MPNSPRVQPSLVTPLMTYTLFINRLKEGYQYLGYKTEVKQTRKVLNDLTHTNTYNRTTVLTTYSTNVKLHNEINYKTVSYR